MVLGNFITCIGLYKHQHNQQGVPDGLYSTGFWDLCLPSFKMEEKRASQIAQLVRNPPAMQETRFDSWIGKICWRSVRLPTSVFLDFSCGSSGKESACNVGDLGSIPGLERSPGEGKGYPLQYSGLENSMDCIVHGVTKSRTRLSDFHKKKKKKDGRKS